MHIVLILTTGLQSIRRKKNDFIVAIHDGKIKIALAGGVVVVIGKTILYNASLSHIFILIFEADCFGTARH